MALEYIVLNKPHLNAEIYDIATGDHTFLVIGRPKESDAHDPSTWGEQAYICDPWADTVYPTSEYLSKTKAFVYKAASMDGFTPSIRRVRDFDPSHDKFAPNGIIDVDANTIRTVIYREFQWFKTKTQGILSVTEELNEELSKIRSELENSNSNNAKKDLHLIDKKIVNLHRLMVKLRNDLAVPVEITENPNDTREMLNQKLQHSLSLAAYYQVENVELNKLVQNGDKQLKQSENALQKLGHHIISLQEYDFRLMSKDTVMEPGIFYFEKSKGGKLVYSVISPGGEEIKGFRSIVLAPVPFTLDNINNKKREIVLEAAKKDHAIRLNSDETYDTTDQKTRCLNLLEQIRDEPIGSDNWKKQRFIFEKTSRIVLSHNAEELTNLEEGLKEALSEIKSSYADYFDPLIQTKDDSLRGRCFSLLEQVEKYRERYQFNANQNTLRKKTSLIINSEQEVLLTLEKELKQRLSCFNLLAEIEKNQVVKDNKSIQVNARFILGCTQSDLPRLTEILKLEESKSSCLKLLTQIEKFPAGKYAFLIQHFVADKKSSIAACKLLELFELEEELKQVVGSLKSPDVFVNIIQQNNPTYTDKMVANLNVSPLTVKKLKEFFTNPINRFFNSVKEIARGKAEESHSNFGNDALASQSIGNSFKSMSELFSSSAKATQTNVINNSDSSSQCSESKENGSSSLSSFLNEDIESSESVSDDLSYSSNSVTEQSTVSNSCSAVKQCLNDMKSGGHSDFPDEDDLIPINTKLN